jgi:hypothetical protein
MTDVRRTPARDRAAILEWAARIGAVTAEALAHRDGTSVASARARLSAAVGERLLTRHRALIEQPALYTLTRAGLRAAGAADLDPCRVSPANSLHMIACARAAAVLERGYADHAVIGERQLRHEERQCAGPLASAVLSVVADGRPMLHRPDLVLWPAAGSGRLPIAVEVELTIKAPRRLAEIVRAWARCRGVAGVLYLAPPAVERAIVRAIDTAHAGERVVVAPLGSLTLAEG